MSFIQLCCERGAKSHVAKEISGGGRRRSSDEKGNQGVRDFRFINILQLFSICFFFSITLLYLFLFYNFFCPRHLPTPTTHDPHPQPTTSTLYPRPTTFSYTRVSIEMCVQVWGSGWGGTNVSCQLKFRSFVQTLKYSSFFERALIFSFRWILIKVTGRFDTSVDSI